MNDLIKHKERNWRERGVKGASYALYAQLWIKQGRKCEICGKALRLCFIDGISPEQYRDVATGHLDHDHKTGAVRGLLCVNCNYVLGIVEKRLSKSGGEYALSEYLRKYAAKP